MSCDHVLLRRVRSSSRLLSNLDVEAAPQKRGPPRCISQLYRWRGILKICVLFFFNGHLHLIHGDNGYNSTFRAASDPERRSSSTAAEGWSLGSKQRVERVELESLPAGKKAIGRTQVRERAKRPRLGTPAKLQACKFHSSDEQAREASSST